jgi:hypothetical protein
MDNISLNALDLVDKWGFCDGDLFYDEMINYAKSRSKFSDKYSTDSDDNLYSLSNYFDQRKLLIYLVTTKFNKYIANDNKYRFERVITSHNPIRLVPVEYNYNNSDAENDMLFTELTDKLSAIGEVFVTQSEFDYACDKLFTYRDPSWIAIFNVLHFNNEALELMIKNKNNYNTIEDYINSTQSTFLINLTDKLVCDYDSHTVNLAAELLYNKAEGLTGSLFEVYSTLDQCQNLIYK